MGNSSCFGNVTCKWNNVQIKHTHCPTDSMSYAYECHWILSTKICENFDATKFRIGITLSVLFLFVCMCARTHSEYSLRKYTSLIRHHENISICSMESLKMPMFTFFVDWQNVWFEQNLQIYSPECHTNILAQYINAEYWPKQC